MYLFVNHIDLIVPNVKQHAYVAGFQGTIV